MSYCVKNLLKSLLTSLLLCKLNIELIYSLYSIIPVLLVFILLNIGSISSLFMSGITVRTKLLNCSKFKEPVLFMSNCSNTLFILEFMSSLGYRLQKYLFNDFIRGLWLVVVRNRLSRLILLSTITPLEYFIVSVFISLKYSFWSKSLAHIRVVSSFSNICCKISLNSMLYRLNLFPNVSLLCMIILLTALKSELLVLGSKNGVFMSIISYIMQPVLHTS